MLSREWTHFLGDNFSLRIRLVTVRGEVVDFAVVLLHGNECVTRYDCAHGQPHRDVLGRGSRLIYKVWYGNLSNEGAFHHARRDLSDNYIEYFAFYDAN